MGAMRAVEYHNRAYTDFILATEGTEYTENTETKLPSVVPVFSVVNA